MQKVEILCALQKLGETLTDDEKEFLETNKDNSMRKFELASTEISERSLSSFASYINSHLNFFFNLITDSTVLDVAGSKISEAKN